VKSGVAKTSPWHIASLRCSKAFFAYGVHENASFFNKVVRGATVLLILKKLLIIPHQPEKSTQMLYGCGDFPFLNDFNFARVYLNTFMRYNMVQIFHLLYSKETFGASCL